MAISKRVTNTILAVMVAALAAGCTANTTQQSDWSNYYKSFSKGN